MLEARTQWAMPQRNIHQEQKLIDEFNISPLMARVMVQRGFKEAIPLFKGKPLEQTTTEQSPQQQWIERRQEGGIFSHEVLDQTLAEFVIDAVCELSEIDAGEIEQLQKLANPTFLLNHVELSQLRAVGIEKSHLKCQIREEDRTIEGTGYQLGQLVEKISKQVRANVVGEFVLQEWNGRKKVQFLIRDIEVVQTQIFDYRGKKNKISRIPIQADLHSLIVCFRKESLAELQKHVGDQILSNVWLFDHQLNELPNNTEIYDLFFYDLPFSLDQIHEVMPKLPNKKRVYCLFGEEHQNKLASIPSRDHFKWLYGIILKNNRYQWSWTKKLSQLRGISEHAILFILHVFWDLGFIGKKDGELYPVSAPEKKDLIESTVYQQKVEELRVETELLYTNYEEFCQSLNEEILNHSDKRRIF